jgi:hypothetical protein
MAPADANHHLKLTEATIVVFHASTNLQAIPEALPSVRRRRLDGDHA